MVEVINGLDSKRRLFIVYLVNRPEDFVRVTMRQLHTLMGCCVMTVCNIARELEKKGLIIKEKRDVSSGDHTISYKLVNKEKVSEILKNTHITPPPIPKSKNTTWQDMVKIRVRITKQKVTVTDKLRRFLVAAMKFKFKTLERWEAFCRYVADSVYLMSGKFKSLIHRVIKFKFINKFLGKDDCEEKRRYLRRIAAEKEVKEHLQRIIETKAEDERCIELRKKILEKYGVCAYTDYGMTKVLLVFNKINEHLAEIVPRGGKFFEYSVENHFRSDFCLRCGET
ncbi:MAG: hypothetical protein LBJ96_00365 [Holosporaceae bacterium]|jgi:hypothetical protein|nr:hypothetical protein [Holosporaceae bacterium]